MSLYQHKSTLNDPFFSLSHLHQNGLKIRMKIIFADHSGKYYPLLSLLLKTNCIVKRLLRTYWYLFMLSPAGFSTSFFMIAEWVSYILNSNDYKDNNQQSTWDEASRHGACYCLQQLEPELLRWDAKLDQLCLIDSDCVIVSFSCVVDAVLKILDGLVFAFDGFLDFSFDFID